MSNELKIVPIEATKQILEGLEVGYHEFDDECPITYSSERKTYFEASDAWGAALAAAPQYPDKVIVDRAEYEGLKANNEYLSAVVKYVKDLLPGGMKITNDRPLNEVTRILLNYGELNRLKTIIKEALASMEATNAE